MRSLPLIVTLLLTAVPAAAQYDPAPLLESLRPNERARVPRQARVSADALPRYGLTIELADDLRSFELEETIDWTNRTGRERATVVLRIFVNAVAESPRVELVSGECLDGVTCAARAPDPSAIVVRPAQAVPDGGRLRIRLRLRGRMQDIDPSRLSMLGQGLESLSSLSGGHGHGDYGLLSHSDGVASMASFFAVLARTRGGVWEQSDASTMGDLSTDSLAHVDARVRAPDGVRVVAAGIEDPPRVLGDRTEVRVRAAFVRDFALVAGADLRHHDRTVGGVTVRSWFRDGRDAAGDHALDTAAHALAIFERRFGAYPWTELDVVEAPLIGGAGGVEFSSMVTIASMFYRPVSTGQGGPLAALLGGGGGGLEARRDAMLEFTVAHEVGHQWWHSIVGSDSRAHPWQDESLAQYAAMLYVRERHGDAAADRETRQQVTNGYHMMRLMEHADAPAAQPVSAFSDPVTYGGLVYGKAPHLYPRLRRLVGDSRFFRALRRHVAQYRFRDAPPRALFARMARGGRGARVRALVTRWLDEAHGDDDLGQADLGAMIGGAGGDDPNTRRLMRMLRELLDGQGGGGGGDPVRGLLEGLLQSP